MRRYFVSLILVTLLMALASFILLWTKPEFFIIAMPLLALYFGVVTGVQHFLVVKSLYKSPRTFVKTFMASTIGVLFIHLAIVAIYLFTNPQNGKPFLWAFCIGYLVCLVFETTALVQLINSEKKKRNQN